MHSLPDLLVHAKSDAEVLGVRPALQFPNVTLLRNSKVLKLNTSITGRTVTQVVVERHGDTETFSGDIVRSLLRGRKFREAVVDVR